MKGDGHVLIETRGEGGYVKCAPSAGYVLEQGDFQHVPTISPLEEQVLVDAAVALDEKGIKVKVEGEQRMGRPCSEAERIPLLHSFK